MAALLSGVGPGDEVIVPSYTFVSTALAFVRTGARVVFCDSEANTSNVDPAQIESLVTARTKVIVPVHYAGVACDMDVVMDIARRLPNVPSLPKLPPYATNNAHMFYLLFPDLQKRTDFISAMKACDVQCVFHYLPLHASDFYRKEHDGRLLPNCDRYADTLVRLPLYYALSGADQEIVCKGISEALL